MGDNGSEKLIKLLRKCRKISKDWESMLIEALELVKNQQNETPLNLHTILKHVCCFSLLTFNVDRRYLSDAMSDDDDLVDWLTSFACFNHYMNKGNQIKSTVFFDNVLNQVEICTARISMRYLQLIENNNSLAFNRFVEIIWPDAKRGTFNDDWTLVYGYVYPFWSKNQFKVENVDHTTILHVNMKGEFLVNYFPNGCLPNVIRNHKDYQRFFGTTDFDVHPASNGIGSFVSTTNQTLTEKVNLTFFLFAKDLVVVERIDEERNVGAVEKVSTIRQLMPHTIFVEHFPRHFSQNFSHWLNKSKNEIEFRPNNYSNYVKGKVEITYIFNLNDFILLDCNGRCLIDMKTATFREITNKITNRLDNTNHVHIFTNINCSNEYFIYLPRLNLNFTVFVDSNCVISNDFRGILNYFKLYFFIY
jgi:hypothetical protein